MLVGFLFAHYSPIGYTTPMDFTPEGKLIRKDIWREGEYLDLWSIPHFLSGMCVGFALLFLGFDFRSAWIIALLLLVAYEMFEIIAQIEETRMNSFLDVVVGMSSFLLTFQYAPQLPHQQAVILFGAVFIVDSILSFFGWRESQKASSLEAKMREEWKKERLKFQERRKALSGTLRRKPPLT